jgi:hypothetical protein
MPEELTYRSAFERLWNEKSSAQFSNAKAEHAADILSVFFARAEQRVNIFCHNLSRTVYDDPAVVSAFANAALRGVLVEIIVQQTVDEGSEFFKVYKELKQGKAGACVNIHQNIVSPVKELPYNFAYVDNHAYRFETDHSVPKAVACAWGESIVKVLSEQFRIIKTHLSPQNEALGSQPS